MQNIVASIPTHGIDGFDPLTPDVAEDGAAIAQMMDDASKRIINNILKSYTGFYDLFSELLQNSLDALQIRQREETSAWTPRLWIQIDIPGSRVRVVDNGVGMTAEEFKYCFRPNVSFKKESDLRGQKGVGATFLAYGYSLIKLQTKRNGVSTAALLRQGRQWADDTSGTVPRPKFEATAFAVPELANERCGTCVEILIGSSPGERPKNLGWIGAQTAEQWFEVLRIKTPLGGVYLSSTKFRPKVDLGVVAAEGTATALTSETAEYYYPHEIRNLKAAEISDVQRALDQIAGDANTKFTKLPAEFKRLDCIWEVWGKDDLGADNSPFASALEEEQRQLIERHDVIVYGSFLRSARIWTEVNDELLKLRKGQRIIHGGLQLASDHMVQGDLQIIPLTSSIGYQANSHVIVHFTDGNPDLGRKTFQPELKELAETLSVRAVTIMKKYLQHMKPDTGAKTITPERELHDWKRRQEEYRDQHPLAFTHKGRALALIAAPQQEQDVVALFHELIGIELLRGYRFFATSMSDRYDSLFFMEYPQADGIQFDKERNRLGISRAYTLPYTTEPKVLEYKYSFDSLLSDFVNDEKFSKQIDLVVCWSVGSQFKERFYLQSLLVGDEGSARQVFGATHQAYAEGGQNPEFEMVVLEDLLRWIQDPATEEARQKLVYGDA